MIARIIYEVSELMQMLEKEEKLNDEIKEQLKIVKDEFRNYYAWKKDILASLPAYKIEEELERLEMDDRIVDDDSIFGVLDSCNQYIDFRVGYVFSDGEQMKNPGIWIGYQEEYLTTNREGPILISIETFNRLVEYVKRRTEEWEKGKTNEN